SGTPQSAAINTPFPAPLVVTVTNASGNPVNGVTVTFTSPSSGASGSFAGGANTATTNASGVATSATFTANGMLGRYTVTASAVGITGAASFSLTNTPGSPASITATSGTPQSTNADTSFGAPLVVTVTDASGNLLSGVTVTFTAPSSGASGSFAGGRNTATTTASGIATSATFTANGTTGNYTVTASVPGATATASFSLTNMDFSVALDVPGTVQITRGTPATVKLDVATIPANTPLPAAVNFTCLMPAGLSGAACSLSSAAIPAGSTSGSTILTINTMAASEQSPPAAGPSSRLPGLPSVSSAALLALIAMLGMMGIFSAGPWLRLP